MIQISVAADIEKAIRWLNDIQRKQIPFAASVAINKTAIQVQDALAQKMAVFDRPKPQTKKGIYVAKSNRKQLPISATVGLKTRDKGIPVSEYLSANIEGEPRLDKRSEILLRNAGILPGGYQTRPGSGARLDSYGNMSRGQIVQILSYFKAFGSIQQSGRDKRNKTASAKLNRGKRIPSTRYFVVPDGYPGLATGIWKGSRNKIEPILIFTRNTTYKPRYDFYGIARKVVNDRFSRNMDEALQRAIATAK